MTVNTSIVEIIPLNKLVKKDLDRNLQNKIASWKTTMLFYSPCEAATLFQGRDTSLQNYLAK